MIYHGRVRLVTFPPEGEIGCRSWVGVFEVFWVRRLFFVVDAASRLGEH